MYAPVGISAGTTSFDVTPESGLDPELFVGYRMRPVVRRDLTSTVSTFLDQGYANRERWLRIWLAGSGASYRWNAAHDLKDLDMLLGVHFITFRSANPAFTQMGDREIAKHINEDLREGLWPSTASWKGQYEVTWYVNPGSWDITAIKPYAAYDLIEDGWTVPPSAEAPSVDPSWGLHAEMYRQRAVTATERYSQALTDLQGATNPAARADAERRFRMAVDQAVSLFDTVHEGRKTAFASTGQGYDDWANYLWQMGKKAGWIPALRSIKEYHERASQASSLSTYGVELPDTDTLIRRAAMRYRG